MIPSTVSAIFFDAVGTLLHPEPAVPSVYAALGERFGSRLTGPALLERFRNSFHIEDIHDRTMGYRTSEEREIQRWQRIVAALGQSDDWLR